MNHLTYLILGALLGAAATRYRQHLKAQAELELLQSLSKTHN